MMQRVDRNRVRGRRHAPDRLQGRMSDAIAGFQQMVEVGQQRRPVFRMFDGQVRGKRNSVSTERPDMQIMNLDHALLGSQRLADLIQV